MFFHNLLPNPIILHLVASVMENVFRWKNNTVVKPASEKLSKVDEEFQPSNRKELNQSE